MLFAHLTQPAEYQDSLKHPTWQTIITWLQKNATTCADGEHEIDGRKIYAIASTVETMPREQCVFESHQKYIDLHYCVSGGEMIAYSPLTDLQPKDVYNDEKDYTLYEPALPEQTLAMSPGSFAVFMPEDGHMPKIHDDINKTVRKIVVKIHVDALK